MRKSSFYMGLGIGLICGAVLLQLMIFGKQVGTVSPGASDPAQEANLSQITEAEWLSLADEFGYAAVKGGEMRYTQAELDEALTAARVERSGEADAVSRAFLIQRGMTSQDVAELLFILGLVDTIDQFNDYMAAHDLSSSIRAGEYRFDGKPELAEIVTRITGETPEAQGSEAD